MLKIKNADGSDIEFIEAIQHLPHVSDFVSSIGRSGLEKILNDSDNRLLVALDENDVNCAYALLCGLQNKHRSIELRQLAVANTSNGYGSQFLKLLIVEAFKHHNANRFG